MSTFLTHLNLANASPENHASQVENPLTKQSFVSFFKNGKKNVTIKVLVLLLMTDQNLRQIPITCRYVWMLSGTPPGDKTQILVCAMRMIKRNLKKPFYTILNYIIQKISSGTLFIGFKYCNCNFVLFIPSKLLSISFGVHLIVS